MAAVLPSEVEFLAFAAGVLGVDVAELSPTTKMGSLPAWDSVAHLRLVLEAEARFGVRYAFERIPELRHLGDFLEAVNLQS